MRITIIKGDDISQEDLNGEAEMIADNERIGEIRVGICDDNNSVRSRVHEWISANRCDIGPQNIREFVCGEDVLEYLLYNSIDILIIDCKMNGIDGIQTALKIRKTNRRMVIVALTDYRDYALHGYDAGIYRYLLKSEFNEKFADVFSGAVEHYASDTLPTVTLKTKKGIFYIPIADIMYVESSARKKKYMVFSGEDYTVYGKISEIEKQLSKHGFIRPHNSYIVNCRYVVSVEKDTIQLRNGEKIHVSQSHRKAAYDALTLYISKAGI